MIHSKIIIHNYTDCSDEDMLEYVKSVIRMGKVSANNKKYCYVTDFRDNTTVLAEKQNKKEVYTFKIYKENTESEE